jgi:hypothetical protein
VMRRQGLNLPMRSSAEYVSAGVLRGYRWYEALSPEPAESFSPACLTLAADILEAHGPAFHALVDAVLVTGEMNASQVRDVWDRSATDAG